MVTEFTNLLYHETVPHINTQLTVSKVENLLHVNRGNGPVVICPTNDLAVTSDAGQRYSTRGATVARATIPTAFTHIE